MDFGRALAPAKLLLRAPTPTPETAGARAVLWATGLMDRDPGAAPPPVPEWLEYKLRLLGLGMPALDQGFVFISENCPYLVQRAQRRACSFHGRMQLKML